MRLTRPWPYQCQWMEKALGFFNVTGVPSYQPVPVISGFICDADFLMKTLLPQKCRRASGPRMAQLRWVLGKRKFPMYPCHAGLDPASMNSEPWIAGQARNDNHLKPALLQFPYSIRLPPVGEGVMWGRRCLMIRMFAFFQPKQPFPLMQQASIAMNNVANGHGVADSCRALV